MPHDVHLQMIQAVISRMATQFTTIKSWRVTVTAALLSIGTGTAKPVIVGVAIYVVVTFAVLDGYYLALERAYRTLYQRTAAQETTDWTLSVAKPTIRDLVAALRSPSVNILYSASLLAVAVTGGYLLLT